MTSEAPSNFALGVEFAIDDAKQSVTIVEIDCSGLFARAGGYLGDQLLAIDGQGAYRVLVEHGRLLELPRVLKLWRAGELVEIDLRRPVVPAESQDSSAPDKADAAQIAASGQVAQQAPFDPTHSPDGASALTDLLANPQRAAALAERERAARNAPGWLGITAEPNLQRVLFPEGETRIEVHERSPAYKAGLRTGNVIKPIEVDGVGAVPLEKFYTQNFPAGTEVGVEFCRPGVTGRHSGYQNIRFKLARWPCDRWWQRQMRVAPGPRVTRKDRGKFLGEMMAYRKNREVVPGYLAKTIPSPQTRALAFSCLGFLAHVLDNEKNRGVWPRHNTIAAILGVSRRTVLTLMQILCWFGVLRRLQGPTHERNSCLYEICWPLCDQPAQQPQPVPPQPSSDIRHMQA
jgi:hypothetical protein